MKKRLLILGVFLIVGLCYGGYRYIQSQQSLNEASVINGNHAEKNNDISNISTSESEKEDISSDLADKKKSENTTSENKNNEVKEAEDENVAPVVNTENEVNNNGSNAGQSASTTEQKTDDADVPIIHIDGSRVLYNGETLSKFKVRPLIALRRMISREYKGREAEARELINSICVENGTTLTEIEALEAQEKLAAEQAAKEAEQNQEIEVPISDGKTWEGDENHNGILDFLEACTPTDEQLAGAYVQESKYGNPFRRDDVEDSGNSYSDTVDDSDTADNIDSDSNAE